MRPFLVVYGSRGGHTRRIAEQVAARVRTLGHEAWIQDARAERVPPLERYAGVILAASVHLGDHAKEMARFVRARRGELEQRPTLFLSVSLTETTTADVHLPDLERLDAELAMQNLLDCVVLETGWVPERVVPIAAAMTDSGHGPLTRLLVNAFARQTLLDDIPRGGVFTDWAALNRVVDQLVREAVERSKSEPPAQPEPPAFRSAIEGAVLTP